MRRAVIEADVVGAHIFAAGVGGHRQDGVVEVGAAAVAVGERGVVHDLQQQVEHVGMGLFDLIQQHHGVGGLDDGVGQIAALLVADVAGGRPDQPRHGVLLLVFAHVDADQFHAEQVGELAGELGLADAGGSGEQERPDRLVHLAEAGAVALDGAGDAVDRLVLAEDPLAQLAGQIAQRLAPAAGDRRHRPPADARHHRRHLAAGDHVAPAGTRVGIVWRVRSVRAIAGGVRGTVWRRAQLPAGTRLVDDVDRLVRQAPVVDVDRRQLGGVAQCALAVTHLVERLVALPEAAQDQHGVIHRRFRHHDLLEAP